MRLTPIPAQPLNRCLADWSIVLLLAACASPRLPTAPPVAEAPGSDVSRAAAHTEPAPPEAPATEPTAERSVSAPEAPPSEGEPSAPGAFACAPPERGFGRYHPYVPLVRGRLLVPILDAPPTDGAYDVLLHFHFHDAVRRAFVEVGHPMALAGVDLGEGSKGYGDAFSDPRAFVALRESIEGALRERTGDARAHVGKLYLSSWSPGFAASVRILKQAPRDVAGAIFLDSLYAPSEKNDAGELRRGSVFAPAVALHVRGFRGVDAKAHCKHLALVRDAITMLRGVPGFSPISPRAGPLRTTRYAAGPARGDLEETSGSHDCFTELWDDAVLSFFSSWGRVWVGGRRSRVADRPAPRRPGPWS